jgi:hypothetical protein
VEPIKTVKMGANIVIIGSEKAEVEAAAKARVAGGGKPLSKVEPMGSKWTVTFEDPADRSKEVSVVKMGMRFMIKGPIEEAVKQKVDEFVSNGAKLIAAPSEATGGGWVAVCDDIDQMHKW